MICSNCQRSGYNFQKMGDKTWCGCCEQVGTRTISQTLSEGNSFYNGRTGHGSVAGLPSIISLNEWQEVIRLCRKVSSNKLLMEDRAISTLPLPSAKNPLDEKPSNKRDGWTPLEDYFKGMTDKDSGTLKTLFEG